MRKQFWQKVVAFLSVVVLSVSFTACKDKNNSSDSKNENQYTPEDFRYTPPTENAALETNEFSVWSVYNTDKIKRDDTRETKFREVYIEGAKGETESGQLIMTAKRDVENYTLEITDLKCGNNVISSENDIEVFVQKYIEVTKPTSFKQGEPPSSPYGTGWYPDALIPYHSTIEFRENNVKLEGDEFRNQGFWFDVVIPEGTAAGLYEGTITLTADDETFEIPMKVKVFDFTLNKVMHAKGGFGIWRWMFASVYDESYDADELYDAYYEYLLKYKVNGYILPGARTKNHRPTTPDTEREFVSAGEFAKIAYEYGKRDEVSCFEIPFTWDTAVLKNYFIEMAKQVINTEENRVEFNIFDKGFLYTYDEPAPENMENVIKTSREITEIKHEVADMLKKEYRKVDGIDGLAESLINMEAFVTYWHKEFLTKYGGQGIESWCPVFHAFGMGDDNSSPFYDCYKAMERGESVWWYGCVNPQYPYINYHIDNNNVGSRVLNWQQKDYDIVGNTYWSTNVYMKWLGPNSGHEDTMDYVPRDVWTDPDSFPGDNNQVNGDGYLFYPGNKYNLGNDPIPSIRLPAIRDGQEDYEYLYQLEQLINEINDEYGSAITMEEIMGDIYDTLYSGVIPVDDCGLVFKARREVAAMIEALSGKLKTAATVMRDGEIDGKTRVNVYAPKNSTVKVNGVAANYESGAYVARLNLDKKDDNVIEIVVENGGDKVVFYRTAPCGGKVIDNLEDNRWSQDEMAADSITALNGKGIMFTAEHGDAEVYNSYLSLSGDFSNYEELEFYAFNPGDSVIKATFAMYDKKGEKREKKVVLRPERWTKVRIVIPQKGVFDKKNIDGLNVMIENPEEDETISVIIDNIIGINR